MDIYTGGRVMSVTKFNDTIGKQTRELPTCTAVHQLTELTCVMQIGEMRNMCPILAVICQGK